jgi:hypothetical protein
MRKERFAKRNALSLCSRLPVVLRGSLASGVLSDSTGFIKGFYTPKGLENGDACANLTPLNDACSARRQFCTEKTAFLLAYTTGAPPRECAPTTHQAYTNDTLIDYCSG